MGWSGLEVDDRIPTLGKGKVEDGTSHPVEFLSKDVALAVEEVVGVRNHDGDDRDTFTALVKNELFEARDRAELVVRACE